MNRLFLDCDGVLANFDLTATKVLGIDPVNYERIHGSERFWKEIEAAERFYANLIPMPDAMALYDAVKHLNPTILTGAPDGGWADRQKCEWAAKHFPGVPVVVCKSRDKRDWAGAGDVIIDDRPHYRHLWLEMGGVWIDHHDAKSSLKALWALKPHWRKESYDTGHEGAL